MTLSAKIADSLTPQIDPELVFCQVLVRKEKRGYTLRHVEDRQEVEDRLRELEIPDLRGVAQSTRQGAFRPLKAAPNLERGWRVHASSVELLITALDHLYPGGLADWLAAQSDSPPVTSYREFTKRQTGMYRITTHLDDAQAETMVTACCDRHFCLRQRLWTVGSLPPDELESKSLWPCLEPCAVLLEFARKVARLEQDEATATELSTLTAAQVKSSREHERPSSPRGNQREADFSDADNPRILQWKLLKLEDR